MFLNVKSKQNCKERNVLVGAKDCNQYIIDKWQFNALITVKVVVEEE